MINVEKQLLCYFKEYFCQEELFMMNFPCTAVILAAGKGTRMKSALPKVLHKIGGKAMVQHVLDAATGAGAANNIVVIGFGAAEVQKALDGQASFVIQREQLGTGHAVLQAAPLLTAQAGTVMVLCGDTPLLTKDSLTKLLASHREQSAQATVLTAIMPDATGYGRIVRNIDGQVVKIVEQKDATAAELQINEVNTGIYCFDQQTLLDALQQINCDNAQGEYYLTDVIAILARDSKKIGAVVAENYRDTMGINSRSQLAEAELLFRQRKLVELMDLGVTIMDVNSTFIDQQVVIGADTVIYPFTWIEGSTQIGRNCEIGPSSRIQNSQIGNSVTLHFTYAHDCVVDDDVIVGPYVQLRPNTHLFAGVKVGNFVEVKNSTIGKGSKVPHLSYIGDTDMGERVNIGSGTITVNYDGVHKHRTIIEDDAFIGCNTNLVAPVVVAQGAYVAAGSTITKNVPAKSLGVARARQNNFEGWVDKIKNKRK
jgi:bifunctional UDP-N-acetylglucosamine pyrophosphorylase/glucosamine-1-phosphate N-acetyltransferase